MSVAVKVTSPHSLTYELLDTVRRFAARELDARACDRSATIPPSVLNGLRELGLFGLTIPERFGGAGADLLLATQVVRVLAQADRSVATTLGLHLGLGTRALVRYGSEALHSEYLPSLASGERIAAFATTEPNAGSDLSKLSTHISSDGRSLSVTGEKVYVTNGALAGLLTITARSDGEHGVDRGLVMLAVDPREPGVSRGPEEHKLGLRASSTTGYRFDGVSVKPEHQLGTPLTGAAQLEHTLSWGRTLLSAGCVGAATTAITRARDYASARRQFGRALDRQPVVRRQLARGLAMLHAMEALVEETAMQTSDAALHRWSVSAKVFCSERAWEVVDTSLQLHGALGFIEDSGLPLLLRDVRVTRIFEGANDVLLTLAGSLELQRPATLEGSDSDSRRPARRLQRIVARLREQLGVRAFARPEVLHAVGSAVVWRDASEALWRRAREPNARPELAAAARLVTREGDRLLRPQTFAPSGAHDVDTLLEQLS